MEESAALFSSVSLDGEEMNVYVKIVKTVAMKVKRSDTIATLKANINRKERIREINQKLFFDGKLLPDAVNIAGCGIQNNATLHLIAMDYVALKIFVNIPPGNRVITLVTRASETVGNIKLMIQEKDGILPSSFTLVWNGNLLEDSSILASVGIRNNSTIHLIFGKKEVRTLYVKAEGVEAVKLCVKVMFTVGDVKTIAMSLIGETFSDRMSLYNAGQQLDDSKTLAFYDIEEGAMLNLLTKVMQIFVKTSAKTVTLKVKEHFTIDEIIEKTFQKLHKAIPEDVVIGLVYAGKKLKHDKDLASYGIQRDSSLLLVITTSTSLK
ncbi:hypothetical protein M5689_006062 [Euphorbia peplus]|nr:hypothetical protein M5689_006062 [Euphorbia peplus]